MSGRNVCKEVTTTCKCKVTEKSLNKEKSKDCVATIVGVLSLPENFCRQDNSCCDTNTKKDDCCEKKDDCSEVYRDFGECLQKCLGKTCKTNKSC